MEWKIGNSKSVNLTTTQFMTQLLGISKIFLYQSVEELDKITIEEKLFYLNFPSLKEKYKQNKELYQEMSKPSMR